MGTTLNQSKQNFRCIGLVNELALTREDCEIKVKDKNGNDNGTKDGERIKGKVAVRIGEGIKTFDVFISSLTTKGEENKQWKNAVAMLDLNPEINGDNSKDVSLVSVNGRVDENSYLGQDGNVKTILRWSASRISTSRVKEDEEHGCTLSGTFFIKSIRPETKDDEETGRLLVTLCAVGYNAAPILIETVVNEDLAEDFSDIYEVGQTASFDIDVVTEHVGAKVSAKKKFGSGGAVNVNSGYDKETLVIVGGDEPIEEPDADEKEDGVDNGWIDPKAMKMALKERDTKLAELKENGNKSTSNSSNTKKSSLKEKKKLGKAVHPAEEDDDNPFDDDDDF